MKSIKLPFPVPFPLSFSGKSKALGFHVTGGGRFHLNQYISASIGAGIGGVNQNISFFWLVYQWKKKTSSLVISCLLDWRFAQLTPHALGSDTAG